MQDISITSEEVLNSLVYGTPFCVIIYTIYKLSDMVNKHFTSTLSHTLTSTQRRRKSYIVTVYQEIS